jgi:hypothetical protein
VNQDLGRISRNESEEIRVSLQEVRGELCVEVRVSSRPARQGRTVLPEHQAIVVPLDALSSLCRVLVQSQDRVLRDGLMQAPSRAGTLTMEDAEPVTLPEPEKPGARLYNLTEPRVPVRLRVECYLLSVPDSTSAESGASDSWSPDPVTEGVTGEMKDVSNGGAQIWLSEHFPPPSRLAVFLRIGKHTFRGPAEVVGSGPQPKEGKYRHNLRWLALNDQAKAALAKLTGAPR